MTVSTEMPSIEIGVPGIPGPPGPPGPPPPGWTVSPPPPFDPFVGQVWVDSS